MTNNEQPKALLLANILEHQIPSIDCLEIAAAELRRLHWANQALLKALKEIAEWTDRYTTAGHPILTVARAAIAKAERLE